MSGDVSDKKRLISVTKANLANKHIYISGHHDFFPQDCVGASNKRDGLGRPITLQVDGLSQTVETDIARNGKEGRPRNFFRDRRWVRQFFEKHQVREGDLIAIERLSEYVYRVYPFDAKAIREGAEIPDHWPLLTGDRPTAIDLFAGCGGFALGLEQAGFDNLLAVEWDDAACQTFRVNISPRILNCAIQEVETFPTCDLLVGGPPCQGFSNLGEKLPNDPRRQLWRHYVRALRDAEPLVFVMENVPPLLKSAEGQEIVRQAEDLGYQVESRVLNSAYYGAPQQRKRAFIIGSRIGAPPFPTEIHRDPNAPATLHNQALPRWKTVRDAIGHLPPEPTEDNWHIGRNPTAMSLQRYRCVPPGGNRWDLPSDLTPDCWKRKTKGGTDLFGRLWWDRPSVTIRTEFYKPEKGRYLHPEEHRPITHREAACLQGFPMDFRFQGKRIAVGIQIGNAVPPPLAKQLGLAVKKHIDGWKLQNHATRSRAATLTYA